MDDDGSPPRIPPELLATYDPIARGRAVPVIRVPKDATLLALEDPGGCIAEILSIVRAMHGTKGTRTKVVELIFHDGQWANMDVVQPKKRFGRKQRRR